MASARDAREDLHDAIRRGLRAPDHITDPDLCEDSVDAIMRELMTTVDGEVGWFVLGDLGHVYRVEHARMTDAEPVHHSVWEIQTRNDL